LIFFKSLHERIAANAKTYSKEEPEPEQYSHVSFIMLFVLFYVLCVYISVLILA